MKKSEGVFVVSLYSPLVALNRLKEENLEIRDFKEIEDFTYQFKCNYRDIKRVKKVFKEAKLIKRSGLLAIFYSLISKKTTLLSLIITLIGFIFASTRIYRVTIKGNSEAIAATISDYLKKKNVKFFAGLPKSSKLEFYENELLSLYRDDLESIEIVRNGLVIRVNFTKRRKDVILDTLTHNLIAKRDGVISRFIIKRGEHLVEVGDFVRKGDILVKEEVAVNDQIGVITFTEGLVYAKTWYEVELAKEVTDEASDFSYLLARADEKVLSEDTKLIDRQVLSYRVLDGAMKLKLHYTIEENIAISETE